MKEILINGISSLQVSPLLHSNYLVKPRTVEMRVEDVHQLAKVIISSCFVFDA